MPSAKILEQKKAQTDELTGKIKAASAGVIVGYAGITVAQDTELRAALRKAGVEYSVHKNSMTARACEGAGYAALKDQCNGMTAIAISEKDPVAPAKILKEYAEKIESFEIRAGFVDGEVLDKNGVAALADIPSKETLVCKIMLEIRSPLQNLAYDLQAIIDKSGEAAEAPATEAAAE